MFQRHSILRHPDPPSGGSGEGLHAGPLMERVYAGHRERDGEGRVWIEQFPAHDPAGVRTHLALPLHLEVRAHSPTGFDWGHEGSGPAQLALALLMDALKDRDLALAHYQEFKRAKVSRWEDSWFISAGEIHAFVQSHRESITASPQIEVELMPVLYVTVPPDIFCELEQCLPGFASGEMVLYCLAEEAPQTELSDVSAESARWWSAFLLRLGELQFQGDICFQAGNA